jgi:hypothetical protein
MQVCKATAGDCNGTLEGYNVAMEACNAALRINKNALNLCTARGYEK